MITHRQFSSPYILEAGVDEVARGVGFGRVYAAAVILDPFVELHPWIDDSKKLKPEKRQIVKRWILENALSYGVGFVEADEIDKINILNASIRAMNIALKELKVKPQLAVVDGTQFYNVDNDLNYKTVIGADAIYGNVAAASILAKEEHDEWIRSLVQNEPDLQSKYGLNSNVGYLTASHIFGIKQHGVHPLHRKTFLRKILQQPKKSLFNDSDDEDLDTQPRKT